MTKLKKLAEAARAYEHVGAMFPEHADAVGKKQTAAATARAEIVRRNPIFGKSVGFARSLLWPASLTDRADGVFVVEEIDELKGTRLFLIAEDEVVIGAYLVPKNTASDRSPETERSIDYCNAWRFHAPSSK